MHGDKKARIREILTDVQRLASEYYKLTGKPLGVTGEVAERLAEEKLGLQLMEARNVGYDAMRDEKRVQIKGRACGKRIKPEQKLGRIKRDAPCDIVLLVLLDDATLEAREMWEASYADVCKRLELEGSKARERGVLSIGEFRNLPSACRIWPDVILST